MASNELRSTWVSMKTIAGLQNRESSTFCCFNTHNFRKEMLKDAQHLQTKLQDGKRLFFCNNICCLLLLTSHAFHQIFEMTKGSHTIPYHFYCIYINTNMKIKLDHFYRSFIICHQHYTSTFGLFLACICSFF